jgi:hypothetical protein
VLTPIQIRIPVPVGYVQNSTSLIIFHQPRHDELASRRPPTYKPARYLLPNRVRGERKFHKRETRISKKMNAFPFETRNGRDLKKLINTSYSFNQNENWQYHTILSELYVAVEINLGEPLNRK